MKLIQYICKGHGNNILRGEHDGILGEKINNNNNNKGVFQGSPLSALLYIILDDKVKDEYKMKY